MLDSRSVSSLCSRRTGRKITDNLNVIISALTKPSRCSDWCNSTSLCLKQSVTGKRHGNSLIRYKTYYRVTEMSSHEFESNYK